MIGEKSMKPKIDSTKFSSITIEGEEYEKDVLIRLSGNIKKRKKKLSKAIYGTSHKISLDEAEHVYENGAEKIIIGSGQNGMLELSDEAHDFFKSKDCKVKLCPTPEAIDKWNSAKGKVIGLFHLTC
ncbi:protein of unknown function DUF498 [Methanohalophilus mahii DSM 5219]|uniref:Uncharacterized protein n=2 Tax=Methanohalophilus mahii TaxID=2176 RepID=D5E9Z7_METMS|nr:protein of unknown function DUF498 [Methanohalophilus mahii DSM 5219]